MTHRRWIGWAAFAGCATLATLAGGCSGKGAECAVGTEGCPCTSTQGCDPGLSCASNRCVAIPGGGQGGAGGSQGGTGGSQTGAGGSQAGAGGGPVASGGTGAGTTGGTGGATGTGGTGMPPPSAPLEPFRGPRFTYAKPAGWAMRSGADDGKMGAEDKVFTPAQPDSAVLPFIRVFANTGPFTTNQQAHQHMLGVFQSNNLTVAKEWSCCSQTFSHWAAGAADTGQPGNRRFAMVMVTTNRFNYESTTIVESILQTQAASLETLENVALWALLNIAQSIGPANDTTASLFRGNWESVEGGGTNFFDGNGAFVGSNSLGEYRLYKFGADGSYEMTSAVSSEGLRAINEAVIVDEKGSFTFDGGVLALNQLACVGRKYEGGTLTRQGGCSAGLTPWVLRVERYGGDRFQMTGVGINPSGWNRPQIITPYRK